MIKRMIAPLIFGVAGVAMLLSLGVWQLQRLDQKLAIIAAIEARMVSEPVPVPENANKNDHNYLRVFANGNLSGDEIHVLTSLKFEGPGYRVVSRLARDGGAILTDIGFIPVEDKNKARPKGPVRVFGNLLWPNEIDPSFTPEPDLAKNIWFARDLPEMARVLQASPILIVAERVEYLIDGAWQPLAAASPLPVTTNIPNDHLEYAITWFSLVLVWIGMTGYLLWRIRQKTV